MMISQKHNKFSMKIHNLCYPLRHTCEIEAHTVKQPEDATADLTPANGTTMQLGTRVQDGHKLYMGN
jgi:hypothetical protein